MNPTACAVLVMVMASVTALIGGVRICFELAWTRNLDWPLGRSPVTAGMAWWRSWSAMAAFKLVGTAIVRAQVEQGAHRPSR